MNRVGLGFDAHAFDPSRPLVLGGLELPGPGLAGHSDADVLAHAVTDALLGAARLGDLGDLYPPDDTWRDASSLDILADATRRARAAGWRVTYVDATVVAERPRLSPLRGEMAARLARALGIDPGAVSVKATTTDGLGFCGRGEGIAALAVVLVEPARPAR